MATQRVEHPGISETVRDLAGHAVALVRLELALAFQEMLRKSLRFAVGGAVLGTAAICGWLALVTGVAAGIAALTLVLPVWLSLLAVFGGLVLLAGMLAIVGRGLVRRSPAPVPELALAEARLTAEALRDGRG